MDPTPVLADEFPNWLELPRDVTASILLRLGSIEILTSAQMVCSLWRNLCKDPSMWRAVDMSNADNYWNDYDLERMCRDAVDRSCGQLVDINLEYFGTDELLRHIADWYFPFFFFFLFPFAFDLNYAREIKVLIGMFMFKF
jgi:uncharacterized protein YbdZ (MbtH family)